jgi:hypothetical protein
LPLVWLIGLLAACAAAPARATDLPADLCSLLSASEIGRVMGRNYEAPVKTVAPSAFHNSVEGTGCDYNARGTHFYLRVYVDPSASDAAALFDKLGRFFSPQRSVESVGDKTYFDKDGGLHVLKGRVRFFLEAEGSAIDRDKHLTALATQICSRL